MNRRITYSLLLLGMVIFLGSCYTVSTIETDVLKPAKQSFPLEIYNVGVVSRMDLEVKSTRNRTHKAAMELYKRDSMILSTAVVGLLDGLAESPRFEAFKVKPSRVLSGKKASLDVPISWNIVNSLAKKNDLDLLISLTAANFKDTIERPAVLFKEELESANSDKDDSNSDLTDEMKRSTKLAYIMLPSLYWRLYDVERQEYAEYVYSDTMFFNSGPQGGLPSRKTVLNYFFKSLGEASYSYSKELAPYWETEYRAWYPFGDAIFEKAGELARNGNWMDASEIWRKIAYDNTNNKRAAMASFNLAVASEMQDRLDLALEWAQRAKDLGLKYYPKHYIDILEMRKKNRLLLDSQMK